MQSDTHSSSQKAEFHNVTYREYKIFVILKQNSRNKKILGEIFSSNFLLCNRNLIVKLWQEGLLLGEVSEYYYFPPKHLTLIEVNANKTSTSPVAACDFHFIVYLNLLLDHSSLYAFNLPKFLQALIILLTPWDRILHSFRVLCFHD